MNFKMRILKYKKRLKKLKGEKYSKRILDNILDDINKITIQEEFVFWMLNMI